MLKAHETSKYSDSQWAAENLNTEFKIECILESRHRNPRTEGVLQNPGLEDSLQEVRVRIEPRSHQDLVMCGTLRGEVWNEGVRRA